MRVPVAKPRPDFEDFLAVLVKGRAPRRPLIMEYVVDEEVRKYIGEHLLDQDWAPLSWDDPETVARYFLNFIDFWHRMGYDYVRYEENCGFYGVHRMGDDTAELSRDQRSWVEEGRGVIGSWEDFEKYRWPEPDRFDLSRYEFIVRHLPEGMGFVVSHGAGVFEHVAETLLGFEGLCYLLHDEPELVRAVFQRTGEIIYAYCRQLLQIEGVGCLFQGDDLGFRTSTFLPADLLRELVLPWHKKLARLAHDKGIPYFLHSCGNINALMEDLIDEVKIDGKHSTEDAIMNIIDFKRHYAPRIAALGGVDVHVLSRSNEEAIRRHTRRLMDECMPGGKFALGSGNSIANYIPVDNYLTMLDQALAWKP